MIAILLLLFSVLTIRLLCEELIAKYKLAEAVTRFYSSRLTPTELEDRDL